MGSSKVLEYFIMHILLECKSWFVGWCKMDYRKKIFGASDLVWARECVFGGLDLPQFPRFRIQPESLHLKKV